MQITQMPATLRYGADSSVRLEFRDGVLLGHCGEPKAKALDDPAAATACALAEPLEYSPLSRCTTPGDRVVLALEPGVPRGGQITAAVIRSLIEAGVQPDGVTVLTTQADAQAGCGDPREWLPPEWIDAMVFLTHDPTQRRDLAYLAASEAGDPILLNRAIADADLVLPIGCEHPPSSAGHYGVYSAVFPTFSDQRTIRRFRSPSSIDARGRPKKKPGRVVDEVGWLLGIALVVQVIPGPGDRVLHVVAGRAGAVRRQARKLFEAAWNWSAPRRASLVVAAIEGGVEQQTWDNVGRALAAATAVVDDGGAIALCSDLAAEPGPAIQKLAAARAREEAMRWIRKERPDDALSAALLAQVLDRTTVYLLSRLDESLVEDLDVVPITKAEELARLADRHESCILLANATHAVVRCAEEGV
ncbi:MAG: DUF2088 domain-containing protein [Planctomycetes bacterium]|nr:DUF2088 domain-containing protein [Planctomycetota bacterium]